MHDLAGAYGEYIYIYIIDVECVILGLVARWHG